MAWNSPARKASLPRDWPRLVAQVKARAQGRCEWVTQGKRCTAPGTDCDHIGDRDDHSLENLQLLCGWHHDRKTSAQGNAARRRVSQRRAPEAHPGMLGSTPDRPG